MITLIFVFSILYQIRWNDRVYVIITFFFMGFIFGVAPVENPNKKLDEVESKVYRRATRAILIIESIVFIMALFLGWKDVIAVITMAYTIVGLSFFKSGV